MTDILDKIIISTLSDVSMLRTAIPTKEPKKVKFARLSLEGLKKSVSDRVKSKANMQYGETNKSASNIEKSTTSDANHISKCMEELSKIGCKLIAIDLLDRKKIISKSKPIKLNSRLISSIKSKLSNFKLKPTIHSDNNVQVRNNINNFAYGVNKPTEVSNMQSYANSFAQANLTSEIQKNEGPQKTSAVNANNINSVDPYYNSLGFNPSIEEGKIVSQLMDLEDKRQQLANENHTNGFINSQIIELQDKKRTLEGIAQNKLYPESREQKNYRAIEELMKEGISNSDIINSALNEDEKIEFWSLINKIEAKMEEQKISNVSSDNYYNRRI